VGRPSCRLPLGLATTGRSRLPCDPHSGTLRPVHLIRALGDSHPRVRLLATRALEELRDGRALEPLIEFLRDEYQDVRYFAVRALEELHDARTVEPLIEVVLGRDTDPEWDGRASRSGRCAGWAIPERSSRSLRPSGTIARMYGWRRDRHRPLDRHGALNRRRPRASLGHGTGRHHWSDPLGIRQWTDPREGRLVFPRVEVRYDRVLLDRPLLKLYLRIDPILRDLTILRMPRATNYPLTAAQAGAIEDWFADGPS
jgi:hypothetical protein